MMVRSWIVVRVALDRDRRPPTTRHFDDRTSVDKIPTVSLGREMTAALPAYHRCEKRFLTFLTFFYSCHVFTFFSE